MSDTPDIVSPSNRRIVEAAKLTRSGSNQIVLEGRHLLDEALEARLDIDVVYALDRADAVSASEAGVDVLTVSDRVMQKLATTVNARGPIAVADRPHFDNRPSSACLVLWEVSDPGNLGTAIRSAAAFGVSVVIGPGCADPWMPKVLRAGAGAHFRGGVTVAPDVTLDDLRSWGLRPLAAVPSEGTPLGAADLEHAALLVGAEGTGLDQSIIDGADGSVSIEMAGAMESLNAGVAASVLAYEVSRRKGESRQVGDD